MIKHIFKLLWNKRKSNGLITLEIMLSFLVLFSVLTFMFVNFDKYNTPLGFDTKDKWMVLLSYSNDSTEIAENNKALEAALLDLDRVENVGFGDNITPFSGYTSQTSNDDLGFEVAFKLVNVNENFASTLGMDMVAGRWFNEADATYTVEPIVVTEDLITRFFPGKNMIDSILPFGQSVNGVNSGLKIIGVSKEYKYEGEFSESYPKFFYYQAKEQERSSTIYLDMQDNTPASYEQKVSEIVEGITNSSSNIIQNIDTLRIRESRTTWITMIALMLICGFLCINVALGLFGVLWYNINKRKGEIGLRRALGAHSSNISLQFVFEIILVAIIGILIGLFFAVQLPLLQVIPIENKFYYYAMISAAAIIIILVTICALYPSLQAAKIRPAIALHED